MAWWCFGSGPIGPVFGDSLLPIVEAGAEADRLSLLEVFRTRVNPSPPKQT
jgi:hypothetical protein